jgi:hypothetical protein
MVTLNRSTPTNKNSELGHSILKARLEQCPVLIKNLLDLPIKLSSQKTFDSSNFIVTGTGSSEAHAKFFVYLINQYTQGFAEFKWLSAFSENTIKDTQNKTLVIFSQGLSPNSHLAFACSHQFRHTILFTSTTIKSLNQAGKVESIKILQQLLERGNEVVYFPIENEYTVLIRLIGPLAGYLACLQFINHFSPGCLPPCEATQLLNSLENAKLQATEAPIQAILSEGSKGIHFLSSSPFPEFGQNLAYKFLEGLYWPMPALWDYLQFSHGPFQQWQLNKGLIIILHGNTCTEKDYLERTIKMLGSKSSQVWMIKSDLPICYRILQYEMVLNHLLMLLLSELNVDQINWPGKGLDHPLYEVSQPRVRE